MLFNFSCCGPKYAHWRSNYPTLKYFAVLILIAEQYQWRYIEGKIYSCIVLDSLCIICVHNLYLGLLAYISQTKLTLPYPQADAHNCMSVHAHISPSDWHCLLFERIQCIPEDFHWGFLVAAISETRRRSLQSVQSVILVHLELSQRKGSERKEGYGMHVCACVWERKREREREREVQQPINTSMHSVTCIYYTWIILSRSCK